MTCVNAVSAYVRMLSPSMTSDVASGTPSASKIVPRRSERRAAMTSGLSGRVAREVASITCHQAMLPDTSPKASIRYTPSRRTLVAIIREPLRPARCCGG